MRALFTLIVVTACVRAADQWVYGDAGDSCFSVCSGGGGSCNQANSGAQVPTTQAAMQALVTSLGITCSSITSHSTSTAVPYHLTNGQCKYPTGTSAFGCGTGGSTVRRICYCFGYTPPTTTTLTPSRTPTTSTGRPTTVPTVAAALGDPHFVTADGLRFTLNSVGDFVYLKAPQWEVQVRTHAVGDHTAAIRAIGIRKIGGPSLVAQFVGKDTDQVLFYVDGKYEGNTPAQVGVSEVFRALRRRFSHTTRGYKVTTPVEGFGMELRFVGRSSFFVTLPHAWAGQTSGLIGDFDGDAGNDMAVGETVEAFGEKWRVPAEQSMFTVLPKMTVPMPSGTDASPAEHEVQRLCGDNEFCAFDYRATGSERYASLTVEDVSRLTWLTAQCK